MEITVNFDLSVKEENLLDMHSFLNVLNVIIYELVELSESLDDPEELDAAAEEVSGLGEKLKDRNEALYLAEHVEDFIRSILFTLEGITKGRTAEELKTIHASSENINSIFHVLRVRAKEIVARADNPHAWVYHDIAQLQENFLQVFKAIELNSSGSYRIVRNIARAAEQDYFLTFQIDSTRKDAIYMPAVFQDVIRDLIANARKYTSPGGEIIAGLYQDEEKLRFVVTDNGRGIPPNELETIIQFGGRGTNVKDRPTRGGGFGLTKAYYVTKKHGGRMWIEQRQPSGTRIEIWIPLPGAD